MFDNIGRVRDDEANRRQAQSIGITSSMAAVVAFAMGWTATQVLPAPIPQPDPPMVCLNCDETIEDPELAPPPPPASRGNGRAQDPVPDADPDDPPPLQPEVTPAAVDSEGSGTGDGPETGGLTDGTGTRPCPPGTPCDPNNKGGGDGAVVVHHTALELVRGVQPSFPAQARQSGFTETRCVADLSIDTRGKVYAVRVHDDCPPVFHRSLEQALGAWRYRPVRTDTGAPTEARTRIAVRFKR